MNYVEVCGDEQSASRSGLFILKERPLHPMDRRLGGTQSLSRGGGAEKTSPISENTTQVPGSSAHSRVTILTELLREVQSKITDNLSKERGSQE
jgi:hypothetical protein